MLGRLGRTFFLILALLIAAPVAAITNAPAPQRVVAIGDLHGDGGAWRDVARAAGLIDASGHWAGGKTILVQTGDVVDRGPDSLAIIRQLMQLQREAQRAGGRVIALVGNHEAMNLAGDLRYVTPAEFAAFATKNSAKLRDTVFEANKAAIEQAYHQRDAKMTPQAIRAAWIASTPLGQIEHQAAWSPKGEIGKWIVGNPAVAMIGDTLFVHGGISAEYAKLPIDEINRRTAAALAKSESDPTSIINDQRGPLWYRGLVTREKEAGEEAEKDAASSQPVLSIDEEIDLVLRAYGAKRIVIGHTPVLSGIVMADDGRLIRIDTGMSRFYGGTLSYLEILDGKPIAHVVERSP